MFSGQNEKPKGAKQTPSVRGGAERRQRQMINIRQKAHGELIKHIREEEVAMEGVDGPTVPDPGNVWSYDQRTRPDDVPVQLLPQFVQMVMNGPTDREVYHGTLMVRKLLSVERSPPHEMVAQSGVIPHLVSFLDRADNPELQFEAAWALTNVAAGTSANTMILVEVGAIPRFINLLSSPSSDCRDQGAWAIGNMAGDGVATRDIALQHNAIPAFVNLISDPDQPLSIVRNATWAISNLCRGKPAPPLHYLLPTLPALANLLFHGDLEIATDASWAISYVSDGPHERVQAVLDTGVVPRVIELLAATSIPLQTSCIRTIGNIASGNDAQTQVIINCGVLEKLAPLVTHRKREIRKETCWTISNIAAGNSEQIDALIKSDLFPLVIKCLQGTELDVKKEAVWSIANVTLCGVSPHLYYLLDCGVIPPLCDVLNTHDPKTLTVALEALMGFLQVGEDRVKTGEVQENPVARAIIECGGVDAIERAQSSTDSSIYSIALCLLETFFNVEEEGAPQQFELGMDHGDPNGQPPQGQFDL
ncbi:importin alpha subunit, putative [Trypanosoma brucei gambiense DAL972]|uniref:Importin subunit alpha n=2 Tax=Trypanosoma brucei TaxID=5691 RepID=C9ZQT2_TRYB9|nr:importin alpha subunit, putative [Trypanosoma brucei gambiense DAL972]RHW72164.1 importin alpha subunit [Trypanosoma brucei equiperdum]CBH11762.1 importin alpha subunit, putative [Trypanosoma brucei gambiense DAL972]|eukprot:XP_011774047.1 importin alpha subunit, putative [Trypanosoma brucei gambiense DAL972]